MGDRDCDIILNMVDRLHTVKGKLAKLKREEKELSAELIAAFNHTKAGQKQYSAGHYAVTIKTPLKYSVDVDVYEGADFKLPKAFNPISKKVSYSVSKTGFDKAMDDAPHDVRDMLIRAVVIEEGSKSVEVKYGS